MSIPIDSNFNRKAHWEQVFTRKKPEEVSWYQPVPDTSLQFFSRLALPLDAAVIDVGAGDSFLVDHLLNLGYTDITVLDISEAAIARAKARLGNRAGKVHWVVSDVLSFSSHRRYDCWHDRAVFHFLTNPAEQEQYLAVAQAHLNDTGKLIMGTFAAGGPDRCSGLPVQQYTEQSLAATLKKWFNKLVCISTEHLTPFQTLQQFVFCSFQKKPVYGHS